MSLEVICDYKESLPSASNDTSPNFLKNFNDVQKNINVLDKKLSLLIDEVRILKILHNSIDSLKGIRAEIKILKKEIGDIKTYAVENLTITKSLNVEIVSLIQEPPLLEDDVET